MNISELNGTQNNGIISTYVGNLVTLVCGKNQITNYQHMALQKT